MWSFLGDGCLETIHDLLVGRRRKVCVELADGVERPRSVDADELVGIVTEPIRPIEWRDRDGQHDARRTVGTGDLTGSPRGRARGDSVVDHDRGPAVEWPARSSAAESGGAAFQFDPFQCFHGGELRRRHVGETHDLVIDEPRPILTDRPHRQFRLHRDSELADDDHVERSAECSGHLQCNRYPATRQPEDYRRLASQVMQRGGQAPAGVDTVGEQFGEPPRAGTRPYCVGACPLPGSRISTASARSKAATSAGCERNGE